MASTLDKIIQFISPGAALKREKYRFALEELRKYDAASRNKRAKGWTTTGGSADREILSAGATIRNRARDMVRNSPYVRKAARVVRTSVVGPGIKISIRSKRAAQLRAIKSFWKNWAETTACDFMGRKNLYTIQKQVIHSVYVDGEIFVRQRRDAKLRVPFQLQVLESDYLDTSKSVAVLTGGGRIDAGIETDSEGRKVAYWMHQQHPQDNTVWKSLTSVRVPAEEILHIYVEERAGQLRGVSELVASMFSLRDFAEFEDAQLIRQKIAACFSVFITGTGDFKPGDADSGGGLPMERVEPGIIERLAPGEGVEFASPPSTDNYEEYSRSVLRGAAAGAGLTYEALTGDLSNVNFSSGRMGWIEMSRFIREWQEDTMILQFCIPVWDWFLQALTVRGEIKQSTIFETNWTAPRREMIDPVKETAGLKESVRAGFTSWQDVIRETGGDPDVLRDQIAEDMATFDGLGAKPTSDPRYDPKRQPKREKD